MGTRKNALGLLALSAQTAHGTGVALDVKAALLLEGSDAELDKYVIEVLTAQVGVAVGGLHFEDAILNGEERDIEGATTEIEDENVLLTLALLVETVGNSSGSGFVDDALDVESSNGTSVLGGLTL